jgi:hypothetical protein
VYDDRERSLAVQNRQPDLIDGLAISELSRKSCQPITRCPEVPVRTVVTVIFGNFVILGSPVFPLTSVAIASPDTTKSHLCAERQLPGNQLIAEQIRQGRIVHTGKAMAPCLERGGAR